jgi:hypothetical protein
MTKRALADLLLDEILSLRKPARVLAEIAVPAAGR